MRFSETTLDFREKCVPFNAAIEAAASGIEGRDEEVRLALHNACDNHARATANVLMESRADDIGG